MSAEIERAQLCERWPAEFEDGYRSGFTGEHQKPCDDAGYMVGHHSWAIERKNAWFAGWNLGNAERERDDG